MAATVYDKNIHVFTSSMHQCATDVTSCRMANRVVCAMKYYSTMQQDESIIMNFVTNIYKLLLDDFIHITQYHNHQINEIMDLMFEKYDMAKCDYLQCKSLSRHYDEQESNNTQQEDKFMFYQNLFDSIHCFLFHSYDVGLRRLNASEMVNVSPQIRYPFTPRRFDTKKYNFNTNANSKSISESSSDTYFDNLLAHIHQALNHTVTMKLKQFLEQEEFDTDAFLQDLNTSSHSNIYARFNQGISRLHRVSEPDLSIYTKDDYRCICFGQLKIMHSQSCYNNSGVRCDSCRISIQYGAKVYHCTEGKNSVHPFGYDICVRCVFAKNSEAYALSLSNCKCICGNNLIYKSCKDCYSEYDEDKITVSCDMCRKVMDRHGYVYHCSKEYIAAHSGGFDICTDCAIILQESDGNTNVDNQIDLCNIIQRYTQSRRMSRYSFQVGFRFYYWKTYVFNTDLQQHPNNRFDHGGYEPSQLYVEAKHGSIKEEVLNNRHLQLGVLHFNTAQQKAKEYLSTETAKRFTAAATTECDEIFKMYNINPGDSLTLQHILSVILYCDNTDLSTAFSRTFRRTDALQTINEIKNNNREFAIWSRLLRETVELFGQNGSESLLLRETVEIFGQDDGDYNKMYAARGIFYCGVDHLLPIPEFCIRLCCPTSTTKQIEVATRFAGSDGIIIQFNNCGYLFGDKLRSFNCSWLSNYSAEDERLFFGGANRIRIENIKNIKTSKEYSIFIRTIYQFNCMVNGISMYFYLEDDDYHMEIEYLEAFDCDILNNLINHYLGVDGYKNEYGRYVNDLFAAFIDNQRELVIDLADATCTLMPELEAFIVMLNKHDEWQINDVIFKLFQNMKKMVIYWNHGNIVLIQLMQSVEKYCTQKLCIILYTDHDDIRLDKDKIICDRGSWIIAQYNVLKKYIDTPRFKHFTLSLQVLDIINKSSEFPSLIDRNNSNYSFRFTITFSP